MPITPKADILVPTPAYQLKPMNQITFGAPAELKSVTVGATGGLVNLGKDTIEEVYSVPNSQPVRRLG